MRTTFILLLLSMFISTGTGEALADRPDKGRPRQEQRVNKDKKEHGGKKKPNSKNNRHKDKHHPQKGFKPDKNRPGIGPAHHGPSPKPGHNIRPGTPPPPPPHLPDMVRYATKGCHDVNVWQINNDTYIVKYRKGKKFYTREIYPYAQRYGNVNLISVNWQPLSPWTLIPSIQLNINL